MASIINASSTGAGGLITTGDSSGILQIQTNTATTATFDASGNVGIGTTSPANKLTIQQNSAANNFPLSVSNSDTGATSGAAILVGQGAVTGQFQAYGNGIVYIGSQTNHPVALQTNSAERMRIDSSGNVLTGTTTASNSSGVGGKYLASATAPSYSLVGSSSSTDASYLLYSTGAAAYRFYVQYDGKIYATNTTITGISDIRLKENIRDLDEGLDTVLSLKPRKFDWKEGKGKDIKNDRGFIAQEFEEVLPDLIDEWKDTPPEGEKPYKSVRADLIPVLVKAIQEQQTIINDLKARIIALEGAK